MRNTPKIGSFRGYAGKVYATITLNPNEPDERKRFTFGVDKARMIIEHMDAIKAFAGGNAITPAVKPAAAVAQPAAVPVSISLPAPAPKPQVPTPKPIVKPSTTNWAALLNSTSN